MVSARVCVSGKGHLYILDKKLKVITAYYLDKLLPKVVEDCEQLLLNGFIVQQNHGAAAYTAGIPQNCSDFITEDN